MSEVDGMVPSQWLLDEKQRRQRAEAECGRLRELDAAAKAALAGVRGTRRTTASDDVKVTFTDSGWEACKHVFVLAGAVAEDGGTDRG